MSRPNHAIVIGASAGGLEALSTILPMLPKEYACPIMVVVHMPPQRDSLLVELLQRKCALRIVEAQDKQELEPGTVYIAPPDYHLLVEQQGSLSLSNEEPVRYSRPSIDVLFETAADAYGDALTGIVLTGANDDGARGLQAICAAGGAALVQDASNAYADAMPRAALKACPQAQVLALQGIGEFLKQEDACSAR
jgi:two-component system chemotaxis response regulator CheB